MFIYFLKELKKILKNKQSRATVLVFSLIFGSLVFMISAIMTPKYRSVIDILIIQKYIGERVDAFAAARSAEYLSEILSRVMYTDSFIDDCFQAPYDLIDIKKSLPMDSEDRKKVWAEFVKTKRISSTGIVQIQVLYKNSKGAENLSRAIVWNMTNNGKKYHGGGDSIELKLIDGPVVSSHPVEPNIFLNSFLGLFFGLAFSLTGIHFFPNFNRIFFATEGNNNFLIRKVSSDFSPVNSKDVLRVAPSIEKVEEETVLNSLKLNSLKIQDFLEKEENKEQKLGEKGILKKEVKGFVFGKETKGERMEQMVLEAKGVKKLTNDINDNQKDDQKDDNVKQGIVKKSKQPFSQEMYYSKIKKDFYSLGA